ncbi:MAG: hypothetical protein V7752_18885 [Halopseudomonas sp.]
MKLRLTSGLLLSGALLSGSSIAGEVEIVEAVAQRHGAQWQFDVTLRHADSGWDHYADRWRIIGPQGRELGERILYHPHQHEQPFTRSLSGVELPDGTRSVEIEAHDSVHGWAATRYTLTIDDN